VDRKKLLLGAGVTGAGVVGLLHLLTRKTENAVPICEQPPPSPQPGVPAGWSIYRGSVSSDASAAARAALSLPRGSTTTFVDSDGSMLGIVVMWHCHDPSEGVTPVGWHKGATLFRIA